MLRIFFNHNLPSFHNRIKYVLRYIERHPFSVDRLRFSFDEKEPFDLVLNYGAGIEGEGLHIPGQAIFFSNNEKSKTTLHPNVYQSNGTKLYSIEEQPKEEQTFLQGDNFQFDWIETIFFHISRYEEWFYKDGKLDPYGRMKEENQFLVKYNLHRIPVVDQLVEAVLKSLGIDVVTRPTCYAISHDIDFIQRQNSFLHVLKSMAGAVVKRRDIRSALRIWEQRNVQNPYDTFSWMLLNDSDIIKRIYFLVGGESKYDNPFSLEHPDFKKAIQLSKGRGYRIGVHPSFESWKSEEVILKEKRRLEKAIKKEVKITRQHFLRFSFPETPSIIDKLGLEEDSTMGFAERVGFRCGTGFPYHLYDFENERPYQFLEQPLVFMDSALFYESKHDPRKFENIWKDFLFQNRYNTQITFNFHNSRFFDAFLYDLPLERLYKELFGID